MIERFDIRGPFSAGILVFAEDDLAVWTLVFHVLQAVHTEGETEAGPEHGEAEDQTEAPGHHAGLAAGPRRDLALAARADQANRLGSQLWHLNLHNSDDGLDIGVDKSSGLSSLDGVLIGRRKVRTGDICFILLLAFWPSPLSCHICVFDVDLLTVFKCKSRDI